MASVNKVILVGNLGRDPEVRYTPDGVAVCNISLATSSQWKDRNTGEKREDTEWHRVVFYNRLAEVAGEYLRKGRAVYVEGRLKTRKFQDKDTGQDRYVTEIIGESMKMLGGNDEGGQSQPRQSQQSQQSQPQRQRNDYAAAKGGQAASLADMDDDIPF